MNIDEIMRYLPHRYPFILVDRVSEVLPNESIQGYKNMTINEPFFNGHFPSTPIVPGVIMIEALAQLAGILIFKSSTNEPGAEPQFVLAGVNNARFKKIVKPGDRLDMSAQLIRNRKGIYVFSCTGHVDGDLALSAEIINAEYRQ